jgi:hypothetical protein
MSITHQEPVPVRMVHAAEPEGVLGDPSHYDGENPPSADQPARLIEGQRVMGWREALNELDLAYPGRLR